MHRNLMTTADQNATSTLQITIPEKKESGAIQTDNPFSSFIKDLPYDSKGATIFRPMIRKLIGALVNQGMIETETYKYFSNLLDINDDALLKKMEQWTVVIISTELWIDSADKSQGKHIGLKLKLDDNSTLDLLHLKEFLNLRSQDLPKYYRLNGAVYISEVKYLVKEKGFLGDQTKAYIMPIERSIDIDTKIDLELCKILLNENNKNNS